MLPNIDEQSQESKIVFLSKKSVSFNAKIDVLHIPTRIEMSRKYMNRGNTEIINVKKVRFSKIVIVFPIPRKEELQLIAQDLWYSTDEITRIMLGYA